MSKINDLRRKILGIRTMCQVTGGAKPSEFDEIIETINACEEEHSVTASLLKSEMEMTARMSKALHILTGTVDIEAIEMLTHGKPWKNWKDRLVMDDVAKICARAWRIRPEELKGRGRKGNLPKSRHLFCYIAYDILDLDTVEGIGEFLDRDHSTVSHSRQTFESLFQYDNQFKTIATKAIAAARSYALKCRPMPEKTA